MLQDFKTGKKNYNEELIISAGLNIMLTDKINLCDLLRIEYDQELRIELSSVYLQYLVYRHLKFSKVSLFFHDNIDPPMNSIILLSNWGVILTFPDIKVALNTEFSSYSSFYHECQYHKSYLAVSVCIQILLWDSLESIQAIVLEAASPQSISRLKSDMISYIYSVSKVTAKNILMKSSDAKELFNNDSIHSSLEGSIKKSGELPPMAKRLIQFKLFQNDIPEENPPKKHTEHTESFEYSASDETEKFNNSVLKNINNEPLLIHEKKIIEESEKNNCCTIKREFLEIESPRFTSLDSLEILKYHQNNLNIQLKILNFLLNCMEQTSIRQFQIVMTLKKYY